MGDRADLRVFGETRTAFVDSVRRGDAEAASAVYAERAMLLAPSAGLIQGRDEIEAFWNAGIATAVSEAELESLDLKRQDGLAFEMGR